MSDTSKKTKVWRALLAILAVGCMGVWGVAFASIGSNDELVVHVFDVGQGDAFMIEVADKQVLIDGGPGEKVLDQLSRVMGPTDKQLDVVVLTHPHADHVDGLVRVLDRYRVDHIIENRVPAYMSSTYQQWIEVVDSEGALVLAADSGLRLSLGADVWIEVYSPSVLDHDNVNNNSVLIKLVRSDQCLMLFTGDAEQEEEQLVIADGWDVDCEILKAGHHGSKTSSSEQFVSEVSPGISVISVGVDNTFGHPAQETDELLAEYGEVYRTDQLGTFDLVYTDERLEFRQ